MRDLNSIGRIGIGDHGAVTRLVFSIKELRSRQLLIHLMRQAGLKIHIDAIGNIFGRFEGSDARAPAVLAGSHLDTVIHGGKYDGPVGVIGALEAVRTIGENKIPVRAPLEVVCFVGEESSRFGFSTLGSSLIAGEVHPKDLTNAVDPQGTKLADVLSSLGITQKQLHALRRDPKSLKAYLELHIEQGPILEAKGKRIGLVTSIAAPSRFKVIFKGQADHSGTTGNQDVHGISPRVTHMVKEQARAIAHKRKIVVEVLKIREENPVPLDKRLLRVTREICNGKGIDYEIMPSGAGHDAMQMAKITLAGMIFVPSKRGISHNPEEWTHPDDIALGSQLLMETMIRVANEKL